MKKRYLMLGLLVAAASAAHAADNKVYKWKDAAGVTHFSDAPPPKGQNFDNVRIVGQSAPITTTDAAGKPADGATATASTAEPGSAEEQKARECSAARQREQLLSGSSQLTVRRDGKDVVLEGAEREAEVAIARARVQQHCPPATS